MATLSAYAAQLLEQMQLLRCMQEAIERTNRALPHGAFKRANEVRITQLEGELSAMQHQYAIAAAPGSDITVEANRAAEIAAHGIGQVDGQAILSELHKKDGPGSQVVIGAIMEAHEVAASALCRAVILRRSIQEAN